jgi:hypothetical protein
MNIKKSLIKNNKWMNLSLGILSLIVFFGTTNIAYGENDYCSPDYSCASSTCLLSTCIDPNCGQTIYGQKSDQACIDNMPCTQTLAGEIGNCTGNPTTPTNPDPGTPTNPAPTGSSGGKASADALTKPGDLLTYMGTYGTAEGGNKYTAECQAVYAQMKADLTAHASDINWYNEYIAEIKVRNMSALLEETVEIMGDGLTGQGAIDFVNKYVNPIVVSKNYLAYSSTEVTAIMATQTGFGTGLNDDKDKLTASKISSMFSNSNRYSGPASDGCVEAFQPFYCANLWITGDKETYKCCKTPTPPQSGCECSGNPDEPTAFSPVIYCATGKTCQDCKCVTGTTPIKNDKTSKTPSLSASVTSGTAPLNDVNFTLTNGTGCINYMCGVGFGASKYEYEKSFSCSYPTAGTYVASIECAGSKIEKTINVIDYDNQNPTRVTGTIPDKPVVSPVSGTSFATSPGEITVTSSNATDIFYTIKATTDGSTPADPSVPVTTSANGSFIGYDGGCFGCSSTSISLTHRGGLETKYKILFRAKNSKGDSLVSDVFSYSVKSNTSPENPTSPTCTASFSASTTSAGVSSLSLTAPATAYLSFNSSGADKLMVSCTGQFPLTPAVEVPPVYSNYPFPFTATQTGTETCTFVPYKNGVAGTKSCSASVIVNKATAQTQPTDKCECTTNTAFGGGDPCTGGTCDGCHCDYSSCKAKCDCASSTPVGSTCSNGCGGTCAGTKNGGAAGTGNEDILPLPASIYKSIWQFQMIGEDGAKRPSALGYKNFNSPDANWNHSGTSGEITLSAEQLYNCDNQNFIQYQNVSSCQYSGDNMRIFKVYLAPGAGGDIYLSNSQGNGGSIVIARFGEPPQGSYSKADITKDGKYVSVGEANIEKTTGKDFVKVTGDGLTSIFKGGVAENSPGGWLYVRVIPNDADIQQLDYMAYANYAKYKTWYDKMTTDKKWDANGDPLESTTIPTPAPANPTSFTGPDCAAKTCKDVACDSKSGAANPWVLGTKTEGCATVTASFNLKTIDSIAGSQPTQAEVAFLTWNSSGASKMEVACTGPAVITKGGIQLTSDLWQADATKSGLYVKPANAPNGYPGWFPKGTSGPETCTFYPTNPDGSPGIPYATSIEVTKPNTANRTLTTNSVSNKASFGEKITLNWTSKNTSECYITDDVEDWVKQKLASSGSVETLALNRSIRFFLNCKDNTTGSWDKSSTVLNVEVDTSCPVVSIGSFTTNPNSISAGSTSTLNWTTTNTTKCKVLKQGGSDPVYDNDGGNGSTTVTPSATANFDLTCWSNCSGSEAKPAATKTVAVTVNGNANPGQKCATFQFAADFCPKGVTDIIETGKDENGCPVYGCKSTGTVINTPAKNNNYVCELNNPGCAAETCHDVYCNDGCNIIKGTNSCLMYP